MHDDFDILIDKLNAFITKYYKNLLLKGLILSLSALLALYLFIDFIEYFAWMGKTGRLILFIGFLSLALLSLIYWVIIPLLKLMSIGKKISFKTAAVILGKHFPEVDDKLVNVLQLKEQQKDIPKATMELLLASISQKTVELKPIPFNSAINFKANIKYLRYFIPLFLIVSVIFIVYPSFITEPSTRIIHFSNHYEKPLPYSVSLLNTELSVIQHNDFSLKVKITGDEVPDDLYVKSNDFIYKLYQVNPGIFEYTFKNLNKGFAFQLITDEYASQEYTLKVYPKPIVYSFDVLLKYPRYLGKKQDKFTGLGDIIVPEGTIVNWRIHTKDATNVYFLAQDSVFKTKHANENTYVQKLTALESFSYSFVASNNFVHGNDTITYFVQVVKDEYPKISTKEYVSKSFIGYTQVTGTISDDYGFHSLKLFYKSSNPDSLAWIGKNLQIDPSVTNQYFSYNFNLIDMGLKPGEGLNYYFEVRDNDALHGFKKTISIKGYVELPSNEDIEKSADSTADKIKQSMRNRLNELDMLNDQVDKFKLDLLDKKNLSWADKQQLSDLINREKQLQQRLDELQKLNKDIQDLENAIKKKTSPELKQRLDELRKMFEELNDKQFNDDLQKLKKELEKMDKDKLSKFLDEMKDKNEALKENLKQNLELFKQMEVEKKVTETVDKLKKLSEKQKDLANKTKERANDKKQLEEKQNELNKEFEKLEEDLDEISKLDKELEEPFNIEKDTAAVNDIKKEMSDAENMIHKNRRNKASESGKNAASKMEKMSENMMSMMMNAMQQRTGEDMEMVKRLLDNLIDLSFQQEQLIKNIAGLSPKDPKFVTSTESLSRIKEGFAIINDSLVAIGKRQVFIKPFIISETQSIKSNLTRAIEQMQERKRGQSLSQQQYALTHINNLALMLEEALDKMKQSMSMNSSSKGGKSCPNPGKGSKPSLKQLMQMQESLSEGLQKAKKGKGKKGDKGKNSKKNGEDGNSAELAKLAAMQYEIRQRLQEYMNDLRNKGGDGNALNDALKDMEKTEDDIINRRITRETIERQQKIKVRLLKSDKAEMQREKEKRRESEEGKNSLNRNFTKDLKYKKDELGQEGIILLKPIELNYYLKTIYKKYIYKIEMENDKSK